MSDRESTEKTEFGITERKPLVNGGQIGGMAWKNMKFIFEAL